MMQVLGRAAPCSRPTTCSSSSSSGVSVSVSVSVAGLCASIRQASTSTSTSTSTSAPPPRQRVVILGSGWAGYAAARALSPSKHERILISPRSHFAFTPLLASTSVGTLEFRTAIEPVRRLGLDQFHQAWASSVDFANKLVRVEQRHDVGAAAATTTNKLQQLQLHQLQHHDQHHDHDQDQDHHHHHHHHHHDQPRHGVGRVGGVGHQFDVPYDKLVIAVGCHGQTFGIEGVEEHAHFLRDVGDARAIRSRILQVFETANLPTVPEDVKRKLLHFVVVGGGPTGIEFAAELHDLITDDLSSMYPGLLAYLAITLYDVAPKVLPMFDASLAAYAAKTFQRQGIKVKTSHHLTRIRRDGRHLMLRVAGKTDQAPHEIGAGMVVWSTGLTPNPLVKSLVETDIDLVGIGGVGGVGKTTRIAKDPRTGGIVTNSRLQVQQQQQQQQQLASSAQDDNAATKTTTLDDVFAIGDCVSVQGARYPATAQVASQQAAYLAKQLNDGRHDRAFARPFRFRNWGVMTYLGGWRAIHQSSADSLRGWAAWVLWRTAYMTRSMSLKNKIMIPVHWFVTYVFGRDISRF